MMMMKDSDVCSPAYFQESCVWIFYRHFLRMIAAPLIVMVEL